MMRHGKFVAIEGPDKVGKSTVMRELHKYFKNKRIPVCLTGEPGGTAVGMALRKILLSAVVPMSPLVQTALYFADRIHHLEQVVFPSLRAGQLVICDRYHMSSEVYQGDRCPNFDAIYRELIEKALLDATHPNLYILLLRDEPYPGSLDPEDRFERESWVARRDRYLAVANQEWYRHNTVIVNVANEPPVAVRNAVLEILHDKRMVDAL